MSSAIVFSAIAASSFEQGEIMPAGHQVSTWTVGLLGIAEGLNPASPHPTT